MAGCAVGKGGVRRDAEGKVDNKLADNKEQNTLSGSCVIIIVDATLRSSFSVHGGAWV